MIQKLRSVHNPVGLRTLKTAVAVCLSLVVVEQYGASTAKIIFAVMGAFAAMEPTIKGAIRNCTAQIISVVLGVLLSLLFIELDLHSVAAVGVGIVMIMAMHQLMHWKLSPVLPCLILITICTDADINAVTYGMGRIWDTAIGLGIGMLINMLVFPYDNSKKIQQVMTSLDGDLVAFLEDMFDGDDHLPETQEMGKKIDSLEKQLTLFADQRLFRRRRQKRLLSQLQDCGDIAQALLTEVKTLRNIVHVGQLNRENRQRLRGLGAKISPQEPDNRFSVEDLVVNYHVGKALDLREQLKEALLRNQ